MGLHSNNETTVLKKNYFEKFIEELDFAELSTQANHLRVWILHGHWVNITHYIIASFYIFSLLKYDRICGKNLEHNTYGVNSLTQYFAWGQYQA